MSKELEISIENYKNYLKEDIFNFSYFDNEKFDKQFGTINKEKYNKIFKDNNININILDFNIVFIANDRLKPDEIKYYIIFNNGNKKYSLFKKYNLHNNVFNEYLKDMKDFYIKIQNENIINKIDNNKIIRKVNKI